MNTRIATELDNEKSSVLGLKPLKHIERLIDNVLPVAEKIILSKSEVVQYYRNDERHCFMLLHGSVALHRRGDGIVLNSESAPFILGVREGANKQVISSQADSLIKISRIWADFFPANTSNQPI